MTATGFLRQRAMIDLSRVARVNVRGVEWVSDGYVLARTDLFKTPPKNGKDAREIPAPAVRRMLDLSRRIGTTVSDAHSRLTGHSTPEVWLLQSARSSVIGVNGRAAAEWFDHEWASVTQALSHPAVVFWQKRRGRLVVVGLLMPVRIAYGTFGIEPLEAAS
jgi:hypothetical protein